MDLTKTKEMSEGRDLMYKVAKRVLMLSLVLSLLLSTAVFSFATSDTPTSWFQEDIKDAIDKNLVPEVLQGNYQSDITRAEYTLLAMKIYEASGKSFSWKTLKPFNDCIGHKYEQQIVAAYNAGIIAGDGKGTFNPDEKISRQQVAVLLVNLLKKISPERDFNVKNTYTYPDQDSIATWARYYVDYCFENKVLYGGTGNTIAPLGNTTIEQSIVLLHRIAKSENLLAGDDAAIVIDNKDGEPIIVGRKIVEVFVEIYGEDTFNLIRDLLNSTKVDIIALYGESATLSVCGNTVSLKDTEYETNLFTMVTDISDDTFFSIYKDLMTATFGDYEDAIELLDEYVLKMKAGEDIYTYTDLSDNRFFAVTSSSEATGNAYTISYSRKKY